MKKFTALLLAFIMVIGLTACGSDTGAGNGTGSGDASTGGISKSSQEFIDALNAENAEEKGVCGADLTWYYKDNVLVIKGTGTMNDYDYLRGVEAPWYDKGLKGKVHWLIIGEGVTSIGDDAFEDMRSLSKAELPSTIETIGESAFSGCDYLSSITIPDSVTTIGSHAFSNCDSIPSITIPSSVTTIGSFVFYGCHSLSSITIPSSVTEIGESAFYCCESLSSVTIPSSMAEISASAFQYCYSLTSVTFEGDAPEMVYTDGTGIFDGCKLEQLTVTYSGSGFEHLIEAYPEINWVKK